MSASSLLKKLFILSLITVSGSLNSALAQQKTLKVAMHADVRTIDPFWTTQTIAGIHGMMVYDTLFAMDFNLKPQPQMVDKFSMSADRKTYTFTLREALI